MNEYLGSLKHVENARAARKLGLTQIHLQKEKRIDEYNFNPSLCTECFEPMPYEKRGNKFCSSSCAASFNNRGKTKSQNTKDKISSSLTGKTRKNDCTREMNIELKTCKCGTVFESKKITQVYCSRLCARRYNGSLESAKSIISDKVKERIKNNTFTGWKSRKDKLPSYPEQYFMNLFDHEQIFGWERDKKEGRWFIDFAFNDKMIALEIDGKQHKDRKDKDKEKDEYLKSAGWKVIRIDWFNPINETNRNKLYEQIEKFKYLYNETHTNNKEVQGRS